MKRLILIILLMASPVWAADYALILGAGVDLTASGVVVDGNGTHACISVTGAGSSIGHATLADCKDDALATAESLAYSNSVSWCDTDGDCTITIAADKELTGSHNAWRVAPTGAGTDSTTDNLVLTVCPFRSCSGTWNLHPLKSRRDIWCGGIDVGATELDRRLPYRGCYPIGYYFPLGLGGGSYSPDYGHH